MNIILRNNGKPTPVKERADDIAWAADFVRSYCKTICELLSNPEHLQFYSQLEFKEVEASLLIGAGTPEIRESVCVHPHDVLMRCHRIAPALYRQLKCYEELSGLDPEYAKHFEGAAVAAKSLLEGSSATVRAANECIAAQAPNNPHFTQSLIALSERAAAYLGATTPFDSAQMDIQGRDRAARWN